MYRVFFHRFLFYSQVLFIGFYFFHRFLFYLQILIFIYVFFAGFPNCSFINFFFFLGYVNSKTSISDAYVFWKGKLSSCHFLSTDAILQAK